MGITAFAQKRREKLLIAWPSHMAKGRTRWVVKSALLFTGIYLSVILISDLLWSHRSVSLNEDALQRAFQALMGLAIGASIGKTQWQQMNRLYFERTGDLQAKANADVPGDEPAAPFALIVVLVGLAITFGWWEVARDDHAPLAWMLALLALAITIGFAVLAYRSIRAMVARR